MMAWAMNCLPKKNGTKGTHFLADQTELDLRVLHHWRQFQKGNESEEESAEEPEGPVSQQTEEEVYLEVEKQILTEADCEAHSNLITDVDDSLLYYHNSVEDEV